MSEQNNGATPPAGTPPAAATPPAAPTANQPGTPPAGSPPAGGGDNKGGKVEISLEEYKNLQRDAARFRSRKPQGGQSREQRYSQPAGSEEGDDDPAVVQLRQENQQTKAENMRLNLTIKVRDLLASDAYKDLPSAAKRVVQNNPLALVDPRAKTVEDAILDIQEFLDDEIEASKGGTPAPATPGQPAGNQPNAVHETPPVNGGVGAPSKTDVGEESLEGKTGPARSTTALRNAMKKVGIGTGQK